MNYTYTKEKYKNTFESKLSLSCVIIDTKFLPEERIYTQGGFCCLVDFVENKITGKFNIVVIKKYINKPKKCHNCFGSTRYTVVFWGYEVIDILEVSKEEGNKIYKEIKSTQFKAKTGKTCYKWNHIIK